MLLGRHWLREDDARPGLFPGKKCPECGWNNLTGLEHFNEIDLTHVASQFHLESLDLSHTTDRRYILEQVRLARAAVASSIRNLVTANPSWAVAWLIGMTTQVGVKRSTEDANRVLSLQQIYACLLSGGPIDLSKFTEGTLAPDRWLAEIGPLVQTMSQLSEAILELSSNTVSEASITSGTLRLTPSADLLWLAEVNLSRLEDPDRQYHRDLWLAVDKVEDVVYGTSARDLLLALIGTEETAGIARSSDIPGVLVVDLRSPDPLIELVNRYMVLTVERWRSRAVPSFFFADPRRVHRTEQALLVQASSVNWLGSAPLLHARWGGGLVGATSLGLLLQAHSQAVAATSSRLDLASKVAHERSRPDLPEIRAKARDVHTQFERAAAAECTAGGVLSMSGIESMDGKPLPCGEIDLLGGCVGPCQPVLLVGECKNFDFTFFKDLGADQARDTIRRATRQVIRKRRWIGLNWLKVARVLQLPEVEPVVVGVIVTRTVPAPPEQDGLPVLAIAELSSFATTVASSPPERWPRHVLRAMATVAELEV